MDAGADADVGAAEGAEDDVGVGVEAVVGSLVVVGDGKGDAPEFDDAEPHAVRTQNKATAEPLTTTRVERMRTPLRIRRSTSHR
ncbi:hypothetical protein [Saccharothrix australiensis]|uniref:hypothetical protein n=1 Tax=Saccharothrix australiensis TaxID=2072 RepID=UPI0014774CFC|nr:hypothetical protein [Saccharothrix australiensis]